MSLKIYGKPQNRAMRTTWLAGELGLDYEFISEFSDDPEFAKVNPNRRVPAISDDGFNLYESFAIAFYLAKKHKSPIWPDSLEGEALVLQWSFWAANEIERKFADALRAIGVIGGGEKDPAALAVIGEESVKPLTVLQDHLADRAYLLGDDFTVADLNVACVVGWGKFAGLDFEPYPAVNDWFSRCIKREAFPMRD